MRTDPEAAPAPRPRSSTRLKVTLFISAGLLAVNAILMSGTTDGPWVIERVMQNLLMRSASR